MGGGHLLRQARDAPCQRPRRDDANVGAESEQPADDLRADPNLEAHVDPAGALEGFLRAMPAMAAHERRPPRREAHLDVLDRVFLVDLDAEALGEDALRIVAVLVRVPERAPRGLGGLQPGEAVGMRGTAARPPDHVELVIVDRERERLDAQRLPLSVEAPVPDLQAATALERVDDLLEQLFLLGKRLLAAPDEEDELAAEVLEPLGMERFPGDVMDQVAHASLVARALEQLGEARAHAGGDHRRDRRPLRAAGHLGAVDADVNAPAPFFPDQRNVPPNGRELAIGGRHAHAQERGDLRAGEIAAREQGGDQLGRPFDGTEPSQLGIRHDPRRIVRSSADLKRPIPPPSRCDRKAGGNDRLPGLASWSRPNRRDVPWKRSNSGPVPQSSPGLRLNANDPAAGPEMDPAIESPAIVPSKVPSPGSSKWTA